MNAKILSYKERLTRMLLLIEGQENIEACFDFDKEHIKAKEDEMIEDFAAELCALNQLTFGQLAKHLYNVEHLSNATPLGTIVIHENGTCEAVN